MMCFVVVISHQQHQSFIIQLTLNLLKSLPKVSISVLQVDIPEGAVWEERGNAPINPLHALHGNSVEQLRAPCRLCGPAQ